MESRYNLRKKTLSALSQEMRAAGEQFLEQGFFPDDYESIAQKSYAANPWFSLQNQAMALVNAAYLIGSERAWNKLDSYASYFETNEAKVVAVIPAGNIPAVGLADMFAVFLSGNIFYAKCASSDLYWLPFLAQRIISMHADYENLFRFESHILKNFDAAIATGSNNTARYFYQYFAKYPHIIRMNRSSAAWLDGRETEAQLHSLLDDMFSYYGMGCRNVSYLMVPEKYDFTPLLKAGESWKEKLNFNKFINNYEYYKSIYLLNRDVFFDNNVFLLKESDNMGSPISVIHFQRFPNKDAALEWIQEKADAIQILVSAQETGFIREQRLGNAQYPDLFDWPDGINVLDFLTNFEVQ